MSTRQAAAQLNEPFYVLRYLLTAGRISPPAKSDRGDLIWTAADIDRARRALGAMRNRRRRKAVAR